jgi:hypothetical protein
MAEPKPGYEKGGGTPEQLPQGEAQKLNENTNVAPAQDVQVPLAAPPDFGPSEPQENLQSIDSDERSFLFQQGPTGDTGRARNEVPQDVRDSLPLLVQASRDPSAPEQLKTLVRLLRFHLGA